MREWRRISSFFLVQRSNTKKVQGNPCLSERSKEMTSDGDHDLDKKLKVKRIRVWIVRTVESCSARATRKVNPRFEIERTCQFARRKRGIRLKRQSWQGKSAIAEAGFSDWQSATTRNKFLISMPKFHIRGKETKESVWVRI
ncbi:hypothetical protein HZH68_002241 [Vespula germanica]|uniref:Uncharacterized protein n=1 Tax=Vespula germanica TaxID=30212 RepID=A0A834KVP5_VESGE|nr:hypothetical protein HZH68_002241 [Vespula germanica]